MIKLPYKYWRELAKSYTIAMTASEECYAQLLLTRTFYAEEHWRGKFQKAMGEAAAYRRMWVLIGGREKTLEDWHEKRKERSRE